MGAMVWTNAADGTACLLIFHESLWMGNMLDHTLVNLNQLRAYGVSIQDNPFDAKPLSITTDDVSVELYSEGTIICGDTQTPTESEFSQLPQLILTSPHDWDPHNICFPSCSGQSSDSVSIESKHSILAVDTLLQHTIYDPIMVASLMSSHVQDSEMTMPSTPKTSYRHEHSNQRNTILVLPLQISVRDGILDWVEQHKCSRLPHNG